MALGPKQMGEAIIRNLKEKTGKSIEQWISVVEQSKLTEKKEVISFLKINNGLGHFQAQKIFEHFNGKDKYADPSTFIDKIFDSNKSKELYEFVKLQILKQGNDTKIKPCETYIPFYRKNQYALLSKGINDSIILGLNLPEGYNSSLFSNNSTKGSTRINSQTEIKNKSDFNEEVLTALNIAYKNN